MTTTRRLLACVEAWPDCEEGSYNPACCRFPKTCSCTIYDPAFTTDDMLEPQREAESGAAEQLPATADLTEAPTDDLWAELVRRGAAIHVGWCYPAQASDEAASKLIKEHGYEFGPWQLVERDHPRLAEPPSWRLLAEVPEGYQRAQEPVAEDR